MKKSTLDVAIVGAGLAGLAAARRAEELGASVAVFDVSDRVGGRVRSDQVGDFICDRGFQLINPSYPALSRYYKPEKFHFLARGVDVVVGKKVHRLADPRTGVASIFGAASGATGSIREKVRFLKYLLRISRGQSNESQIDASFEEEMLEEGIGTFYARAIGPFASGVFLNHPAQISARVARELIHYFMIGNPGLPYGGVSSVSQELALGLDIHLNSAVDEIGGDYIRLGRKKVKARSIIVATDAIAATSLIGEYTSKKRKLATKMSASTTWYHSVVGEDFPGLLRIDGMSSGPITNTIAISKLAPEYAPSGQTLISTTVMNSYGGEVSEARVRKHLSALWGRETHSWKLVSKYSIPKSLPLMFPGVARETSVKLPSPKTGVPRFLAGDYLGLPAQQGAMESGIDVAEQAWQTL